MIEQVSHENQKPNADPIREYLYDTFGKSTNGKPKETFVLNAFWQRLYLKWKEEEKNPTCQVVEPDMWAAIMPIAQYYVPRSGHLNNRWGLIDLYFPYINVGIECNEKYHQAKEQQEKDAQREREVKSHLKGRLFDEIEEWLIYDAESEKGNESDEEIKKDAPEINQIKPKAHTSFDYLPIGIDAEAPLDHIYATIDQAIKVIIERTLAVKEDKNLWNKICQVKIMDVDQRDVFVKKKELLPESTPGFRIIGDVRRFFEREKANPQNAWFKLRTDMKGLDHLYLWTPKLGSEPLERCASHVARGAGKKRFELDTLNELKDAVEEMLGKVEYKEQTKESYKITNSTNKKDAPIEKVKSPGWLNFVGKYEGVPVLVEVECTEKDKKADEKGDVGDLNKGILSYRITFGKHKGVYRYLGIYQYLTDFELSDLESTTNGLSKERRAFVYARVARKLSWGTKKNLPNEIDLRMLKIDLDLKTVASND